MAFSGNYFWYITNTIYKCHHDHVIVIDTINYITADSDDDAGQIRLTWQHMEAEIGSASVA